MDEAAFKHYKIGVDTIDTEHWNLFEALNKITPTITKAELTQFASEMLQLLQSHFATEEELMEKIAFPYAHTHREDHKKLSQQFESFVNKIETDNIYNNEYLKKDLEKLFLFHIDNFDAQYGAWAKKINFVESK